MPSAMTRSASKAARPTAKHKLVKGSAESASSSSFESEEIAED